MKGQLINWQRAAHPRRSKRRYNSRRAVRECTEMAMAWDEATVVAIADLRSSDGSRTLRVKRNTIGGFDRPLETSERFRLKYPDTQWRARLGALSWRHQLGDFNIR
jgi:hypothetical protein